MPHAAADRVAEAEFLAVESEDPEVVDAGPDNGSGIEVRRLETDLHLAGWRDEVANHERVDRPAFGGDRPDGLDQGPVCRVVIRDVGLEQVVIRVASAVVGIPEGITDLGVAVTEVD